MAIFESIFDILYLSLVIGLGLRLLLEKQKGAKLFGVMAILLGLGDACHLLPRVVSHLSPLGFEGHAFALSWGQCITSITMTIFYVFYYYYYRNQSGDKDRKKMFLVHFLAILRIVIVLLPQNQWGQVPGNYLFGIYRNIPFAILGILLIFWSYKSRDKAGLEHMDVLIGLSFLFYLPVVLWSDKYPILGALMMPKTLAYLLIVVLGYKYYIKSFSQENLLGIAFINLVMGLMAGVFYREFTKFYGFSIDNHLAKLHVHLLVLGVILPMLLYFFTRPYDATAVHKLRKAVYTFISGLTFTVVMMVVLGIYDVVHGTESTVNLSAMNGISGLGHILLATGLIWTFIRLYELEKSYTHSLQEQV